MNTETKATASPSSTVAPSPSITPASLVAAGLTLRGMTVSSRTLEKEWEGVKRTETEVGISDGEQIFLWKIKHDGKEILPKLLVQVSVRVTYCTTDKGKITVSGLLAA